jgi:2-methylcitrate dehydratase PrpD
LTWRPSCDRRESGDWDCARSAARSRPASAHPTRPHPIGHRRRRKEGIPLLEAKFRTNLARRFPKKQQDAILAASLDQKKLEALPGARVRRPLRHLT